jgi:hypothetical protein
MSEHKDPVAREGRIRLSLDIDPKAKAQLDLVRKRTGSTSLTDVVRRAVALLDLVSEHNDLGGTLIFKHKDGSEERLRLL